MLISRFDVGMAKSRRLVFLALLLTLTSIDFVKGEYG